MSPLYSASICGTSSVLGGSARVTHLNWISVPAGHCVRSSSDALVISAALRGARGCGVKDFEVV